MKTKSMLTALIGIGAIAAFQGCYTQIASNPEREESYSYREEPAYEENDSTTEAAPLYDDEDSYARRRLDLGFQYYYPSWSSHVYIEPWWPSVSFGYYYDGWLCGTPYVSYPWYYHYPYYPYHGWAYGSAPYYGGYHYYVDEPAYKTRNSGTRRGSALGSRDDGRTRDAAVAPANGTLPVGVRNGAYGTAGNSRTSTGRSRNGLEAIFGRPAESRTSTARGSAPATRQTPATREDRSSSSGGRTIIISRPSSSSRGEGRGQTATPRTESSRPSYSPPARSSSPAPSAPPSSSGGSRGSSSGNSSGDSRSGGSRR